MKKRPVNLGLKFTGRFEHGGLLTVLQQVVFQQGLVFDHGIELFHRGEQSFHVFHRHGHGHCRWISAMEGSSMATMTILSVGDTVPRRVNKKSSPLSSSSAKNDRLLRTSTNPKVIIAIRTACKKCQTLELHHAFNSALPFLKIITFLL